MALPSMMEESLTSAEKTGLSLVAFRPKDPAAYGRVLTNADGTLDRIVEYKDATPAQRAVDLCCAGTYSFASARKFFEWAAALKNDNAQKEYYLPEVSLIAKAAGVPCAITLADEITEPAATRVFARSPFGYGHDPAGLAAFGLLAVLPVGPLLQPAASTLATANTATAARLTAGCPLRGRIGLGDSADRRGQSAW